MPKTGSYEDSIEGMIADGRLVIVEASPTGRHVANRVVMHYDNRLDPMPSLVDTYLDIDYRPLEMRALAEMISNPRIEIQEKDTTMERMKGAFAGIAGAALAMAAASSAMASPDRRVAIMPARQSGKTREGESRADRKRRQRQADHSHTHVNHRGESRKLARRLHRKFLMGRAGAF